MHQRPWISYLVDWQNTSRTPAPIVLSGVIRTAIRDRLCTSLEAHISITWGIELYTIGHTLFDRWQRRLLSSQYLTSVSLIQDSGDDRTMIAQSPNRPYAHTDDLVLQCGGFHRWASGCLYHWSWINVYRRVHIRRGLDSEDLAERPDWYTWYVQR